MKILSRAWFFVGSFLLWIWDFIRGTIFSTSSDCAQDGDGAKAIANQMACDRARGSVAAVTTTAELAHMMLRDLQIATQNRKPAVIHGNIAHRGSDGNGADFCVAKIGHSWVIATEGGEAWSAFLLFGLLRKVFRLNWEECIDYLFGQGLIKEVDYFELRDTQFRSLKLSWLLRFYRLGFSLPGEWVEVEQISTNLETLWCEHKELVVGYRDAFHNTYLLATAAMLYSVDRLKDSVFIFWPKQLKQKAFDVRFVHRLKEVPQGILCMTEVSAGHGGTSLLGLEAKASPDLKGDWPDPLPGWYSGARIYASKFGPSDLPELLSSIEASEN